MDDIEDFYPLSPMQEGMLFHALNTPQSVNYITQASCILNGDLEIEAFEHSWRKVTERHPVLRTFFIAGGGRRPVQVVQQHVELSVEHRDWRGASWETPDFSMTKFLRSDLHRGFDMSEAPLLRLTLIRSAESEYRFIWTFHHIILDGWSVFLVLNDLFALYHALCLKEDVKLATPRLYRDYIVWLQRQNLSAAKEFWRHQLKGFTKPTFLAGDQLDTTRADRQADPGEQSTRLSATATENLQAFARKNRLTLNTVAQGAWALILSRYSGQEDVVFGTVVSGRPPDLVGVESMVGLFINTLPVRVTAPSDALLTPWLKQLQIQQAEVRRYEYSPLTEIQKCGDWPRGAQLFESGLDFDNVPTNISPQNRRPSRHLNLSIQETRTMSRSNIPLVVRVNPSREISLRLSYDRRRFDDALITQILGHFRTILENISSDSDQRLSDLSILGGVDTDGLNPDDFPDADLSRKDFESIVRELSRVSKG
jgi:hypothetical protein